MQLNTGTTLQGGKYTINQFLGQGGFGITYLATQDILDRQVAVKEFFFREYCERDTDTSHVTLGTQANKDMVERFLQKFIKEARTISKLQHQNIIQIYDIFRENGTAYYVMEYIDGESLGDMVKRRGPLPETEALGYIRQVGDALGYIHQHSINHLDVKPSNIMVRKQSRQVVLIDFGVAKQYDESTKEGTTTTPVGISHGYSPAEQYKRQGVQTFSPQSDVYSLAATLYKLLTGTTPPEALDVQDMGLPLYELQERHVSPHIVSAIQAAMQSRSMRTQSIEQFIANLDTPPASADEETHIILAEAQPDPEPTPAAESVLDGFPVETPTSDPQPPRRTPIYIAAACAAVLILGGIGYAVYNNQTKEQPALDKETMLTELIQSTAPRTVTNQELTIGTLGKCKYTGPVNAEGLPHGQGTAVFDNHRTYEGPFVNGVAEGPYATFTFENGDIFQGLFKNNEFAQGRYTVKQDGSYFSGAFKNGEPAEGNWYDKNDKLI